MTYAYLQPVSESEPPANSDVSNTSNWALRNDEVYSRDVSGKEMAIYRNNSLLEYPTYGLDMIGKIKDDELHFYLKDHLGSIRATIYDNKLMSAQDYDAWGYILEGRTYESEQGKFKFTGKERDEESFYDYFGARYYDARVGRWGQVEPLLDKYVSISPYSYSICNPLKFSDVNGKDAIVTIDRKNKKISIEIIFNYSLHSKSNPLGISEKQFTVLKQLGQNIHDLWTGPFEINGTEYQVNTTVSYKSFETFDLAIAATQDNEGQNTVKNVQKGDYIEGDIGIGTVGSTLFLSKGKKLNPRWDTGAHEAGHLLGLPDIGDKYDKSIMSYAPDRRPPGDEEMESVFERNRNLNIKIFGEQRVKGNVP